MSSTPIERHWMPNHNDEKAGMSLPKSPLGIRPAAVLCIGFNRPDLLEQVLNAVRLARPRTLMIAVDGPRQGHPEDEKRCAETRALAQAVDWANTVHLKLEKHNLGCDPAVVSAINWAFGFEEEIIVLEDDCLPDPSFFQFCDILLDRYRDDKRIMHIAGSNWGAASDRFHGRSYAFTSFAATWGWATWRRAWSFYEGGLNSWPRFKSEGMAEGMAISRRFRRLLEADWNNVWAGLKYWDREWQYAVIRHNGLSICPAKNLIVNTGFRSDGTNFTQPNDRIFSRISMEAIALPLRHPPEVARNASVESVFERIYWQRTGWLSQLYRRLVRNEQMRKMLRVCFRYILPQTN